MIKFGHFEAVAVFNRPLTAHEIKLLDEAWPMKRFFSAWRRNRYHWLKTKR